MHFEKMAEKHQNAQEMQNMTSTSSNKEGGQGEPRRDFAVRHTRVRILARATLATGLWVTNLPSLESELRTTVPTSQDRGKREGAGVSARCQGTQLSRRVTHTEA